MKAILLYLGLLVPQLMFCQSKINLAINELGVVDAEIEMHKVDSTIDNYLFVPLNFNEITRINSAGDVTVSPISKNERFTIFSVISPINDSIVNFNISNIGKLTETHEAKSQLTFENIYSYLSQNEKDLLNLKNAIHDYMIFVKLPKKYDETAVNFKNLKLIDKENYSCQSSILFNKTTPITAWLVFPNSQGSRLKIALIIFTFLFSCFSLLFYVPALKERNFKWSITILLASLALLIFAYYYSTQYPKGIEFVVGISGAIPHVAYGAISSVYLLLARYYSVKIFGKITLDGSETKLVEITILKLDNGTYRPIKKKNEVKSNGSYSFNLWVRKNESNNYKIETTHRVAGNYTSSEFTLSRGEKHEELINLTTQ